MTYVHKHLHHRPSSHVHRVGRQYLAHGIWTYVIACRCFPQYRPLPMLPYAAPRGRMHSHRPLSQLLCPQEPHHVRSLDTLHLSKVRLVWEYAITTAAQRFGLGVFSSQGRQWKKLYTSKISSWTFNIFLTIGPLDALKDTVCWHLIVLVNLFLWISNLGHLHCHPHENASHLPESRKPWKLLSATAYWRDSSRFLCSRNTLHCGISPVFTWAKHAKWSNKCGDTSTPSFPPYTTSRRVVTSQKYPSISDIRADFVGFGMGSLGNLPHIQHDLLLLPMPGHHKLPQECNTGVFSK